MSAPSDTDRQPRWIHVPDAPGGGQAANPMSLPTVAAAPQATARSITPGLRKMASSRGNSSSNSVY